MGWFNRKFIYEDKTFQIGMLDIYRDAYMFRQEADYDLIIASELSTEQIKTTIENCKTFTETIFKHLTAMNEKLG